MDIDMDANVDGRSTSYYALRGQLTALGLFNYFVFSASALVALALPLIYLPSLLPQHTQGLFVIVVVGLTVVSIVAAGAVVSERPHWGFVTQMIVAGVGVGVLNTLGYWFAKDAYQSNHVADNQFYTATDHLADPAQYVGLTYALAAWVVVVTGAWFRYVHHFPSSD